MRWEIRGQHLGESGQGSVVSCCKNGNEQYDSKTTWGIICNEVQFSWGSPLQDAVCVSEHVVCTYTREAFCVLTSCRRRIVIVCSVLNVDTWWIWRSTSCPGLLNPGTERWYHWIRRWAGLTTGMDLLEKRQISCHTGSRNPDLPARSIVTKLPDLPRVCGITDKLWIGKNLEGICRLIERLSWNLLGGTLLMG